MAVSSPGDWLRVLLYFLIAKLTPGDPISNALAGQLSADAIEQIRQVYGLDKSAVTQYFIWLKNLLSGDWGMSLTMRTPVAQVLGESFTNTVILTVAAVVLCLITGVIIGVFCGLSHGTRRDRLVMLIVQAGYNHEQDPARKAYVDKIEISFTGNNPDSIMQRIQAGDADLSLYLDAPPQAVIRQYVTQNNPALHAANSGAAKIPVVSAPAPGHAIVDPQVCFS